MEVKKTGQEIAAPTPTPKQMWDSEKEAQACLKEWKDRLGLQDWHIQLVVTTEVPEDSLGFNRHSFIARHAVIFVLAKNSARWENEAFKPCQEKVLIHELLHCIIPGFDNSEKTIESCWYSTWNHGMLERMSRAMYLAKYNLPCDWFNV